MARGDLVEAGVRVRRDEYDLIWRKNILSLETCREGVVGGESGECGRRGGGEGRACGAGDQRSVGPRSRLDPDPVPAAALNLPCPRPDSDNVQGI
jgi:hypothetical protein